MFVITGRLRGGVHFKNTFVDGQIALLAIKSYSASKNIIKAKLVDEVTGVEMYRYVIRPVFPIRVLYALRDAFSNGIITFKNVMQV